MAISEEFANNASGTVKSGGLLFDRRVTRTISPGTLIDEKFMDPYENSYLLAIHPLDADQSPRTSEADALPLELTKGSLPPSFIQWPVGIAWLDLSTGEFYTQPTTLGTLPSETSRIGAREIVISKGLEDGLVRIILDSLEQQRHLVTLFPTQWPVASMSSWTPMLETEVPPQLRSNFSDEEVAAGTLLLEYVNDRLQGSGVKLQPPVRRQDKETMSIDKHSMRALEILGTSKDGLSGGKGSLLHTVRRTVTKGGARLLRDWIGWSHPSFKRESSFLSRSSIRNATGVT